MTKLRDNSWWIIGITCGVIGGLWTSFEKYIPKLPLIVRSSLYWTAGLALAAYAAWITVLLVTVRRRGGSPAPVTDARSRRRGLLMTVGSIAAAAGLFILGYFAIPAGHELVCRIVACAAPAVLLLLYLVSLLCRKAYIGRLNSMSVRERQSYLLSHRDAAEQTAREKLSLLKRIIRMSDAAAVSAGLVSAVVVTAYGGTGATWTMHAVPVVLAAAAILLLALSRIRFPATPAGFVEDESYIREADYPILYAKSRRAMQAVGVKKELRICLLTNFSASIAASGELCILFIGAQILGLLSEDELYNILLHEFRHVADDSRDKLRVKNYGARLAGRSGYGSLVDGLNGVFFTYPDTVCLFELELFSYADSLLEETAADAAMAQHGDAAAAASALLKVKYHELFEWEEACRNYTPDYADPDCERPFMQNRLEQFEACLAEREPLWHDLFGRELLARNATHPTINMRVTALGVPDPVLLPKAWSTAYAAEIGKAFAHADKQIADSIRDCYEEERRQNYLDRLERVEKWEADGCPIAPETYADLIADLGSLGRVDDALALCDRVLEAWPGSGSDSAAFRKGTTLLHRFDEAGVDYVYRALEINPNFIDPGLDALGEFFCLTGRRQELDEYRERAIAKLEEQNAKFSRIGELIPTDTLETEHLPGDQAERLQAFLTSVADGHIQEVYLVHKPITDDFSTSPVIVRFMRGTTDEQRRKIMHKIFRYLDSGTEDWQYSLFDFDEIPKMQSRIERVPGSLIWKHSD